MSETEATPAACKCGCGQPAFAGSEYAGENETSRAPHRVKHHRNNKRAYALHLEVQEKAAARMRQLGLGDASLTELATDLRKRADDFQSISLVIAAKAEAVDEDAIAARIEQALQPERDRASRAEAKAAKLRVIVAEAHTTARAATAAAREAEGDAAAAAERLDGAQAQIAQQHEQLRALESELDVARQALALARESAASNAGVADAERARAQALQRQVDQLQVAARLSLPATPRDCDGPHRS